jgi:3-dehydroquinate synthase
LRALLNFGHTIGHAIENAAGYGRYLHGEAVSLGISAALDLSVEKAGLPVEQAEKVRALLDAFDLPLQLAQDISSEALLNALRKDKKFEAGSIRFVLTRSLGSAYVSKEVTDADVHQVIENLKSRA